VNGRQAPGFSLIELVITMAIVATLLSIAIPGYTALIERSRREDARHLLMVNAQRLQRCFTLEGAYDTNCVTRPLSRGGFYTLSPASRIDATTFALVAEPRAGTSQRSDAACRTFTYDHTGRRGATGTSPSECW